MTDLITLSPNGFYCAAGDFYIDPWHPVRRAVISHAHADHYTYGCERYLVNREGAPVFRARLGDDAPLRTLPYGEQIDVDGVKVSLHPAGHILGSSQIRVEHKGEVWVVSGDYKTTDKDSTCQPFEPVPCDTFITEATFALSIFHWRPQAEIFADLNAWWQQNREADKTSIVFVYALGKAQRVLAGLDPEIGPIYTHGAVERITQAYRKAGVDLPTTTYVNAYMEEVKKPNWRGSLILTPLSTRGTTWLRKFNPYSTASVSGWMQIRGVRRRRAVDRGFILSDHADWQGLQQAIRATEAEQIGVTHGYVPAFVRHLSEQGYHARAYDTRFSAQAEEEVSSDDLRMTSDE
ncbi:MAG: ligase-associated DNA damage response exonuclease [Chloroflexota bacterium]